jgi:hypothetical protein
MLTTRPVDKVTVIDPVVTSLDADHSCVATADVTRPTRSILLSMTLSDVSLAPLLVMAAKMIVSEPTMPRTAAAFRRAVAVFTSSIMTV